MVNKQSLWFVTLFSLIVILGIYYFSADESTLNVLADNKAQTIIASKDDSLNSLSVLKVSEDEATIGKIDELEEVLIDTKATLEEKNNAYDELKVINQTKTKENEIKDLIKKEFDLDSFVKIDDYKINIVISKNEHNFELANKVINKVQTKFDTNKYITVKFNKE